MVRTYETYIPRRFKLDNDELVTLPAYLIEEALVKEPIFHLWVPPELVEGLYNHLLGQGFELAIPSIPKGERYSVRKVLDDTWELHLRIYANGFIEPEVEVRREYVEHLGDRRMYVVYEAFEFYRDFYDSLYIYHKPSDRWVVKVLDNFRVELRPPTGLTPWKPIVAGAAVLATAGLLIYTLSKLKGSRDGGS